MLGGTVREGWQVFWCAPDSACEAKMEPARRQVDTVKGENTQLRDENGVLKDYLNNLMAKACNVAWFACPEVLD